MSRYRNKQSNAEMFLDELVNFASILPWWSTLPVALLLFIFIPGVPSGFELQQPADIVGVMLGILLKYFLKYLLPMTLVIGTLINIFSKFKSNTLFNSIKKNGAHQTMQNLDWKDFEFLLSEWFKKEGFNTEITGGGGADGGIDIKLYKNGEVYLVQCKHYKDWKVSVSVVRELFGVMNAEDAAGGYIVTSGRFTNEALSFARNKNIILIDGKRLSTILDASGDVIKSQVNNREYVEEKSCPRCGSKLVERTGKRGRFIGCSSFPRCRYTANIES